MQDRFQFSFRSLIRWWRDYQWAFTGLLWVIGLYLGYTGWGQYAITHGASLAPLDRIYLTLQLIPMNSGAVPGPLNWQLEVARLLIPAVTALTAFQALAILFREQVQFAQLWFSRGHIIICGLSRMGFLLMDRFRRQGERVVVIERNVTNDWITQCRERQAMVIKGDATDPALLRRAAINRARLLIAVTGDDGVNAEIAVRTQEVSQRRMGDPLTCIIHITDSHLCTLLREREISAFSAPVRLEMLNIYDRGARLMLQEYSPFDRTDQQKTPPHLLVLGLGRLGESLIVQAAWKWYNQDDPSGERVKITALDYHARERCAAMLVRYPQLAKACDLTGLNIIVHSPEFEKAEFLRDDHGDVTLSAVYICLDDDPLGLHAGLALMQHLRGTDVPIVVRMAEEQGLALLLKRSAGESGPFANLHAFGLYNRTCTPEIVVGGTHEILARALHEEYIQLRKQQGASLVDDPALQPWERLSLRLREANYRQADRLCASLQAIQYGIAPLTDWEAARLEFSVEEVEILAQREHTGWMMELRHQGWKYAPGTKDDRQKTHPALMTWEHLPEIEREKNRTAVRELPAFLARAGFQVYRTRKG